MADPPPRVQFVTAVAASTLPMPVKAVGYALATFMRRDGRAWPSVAALSFAAGCSERTARRSLRSLEAAGLLVTERHRGTPSWYRPRPDGPPSPATRAVDLGHGGPPPRPETTETPATVAPELEDISDLPRTRARARDRTVADLSDDEFREWVDRRRENGEGPS